MPADVTGPQRGRWDVGSLTQPYLEVRGRVAIAEPFEVRFPPDWLGEASGFRGSGTPGVELTL